ncbi:F-box protein At3g07870-like [Papaver somniferum]|uniref:F-box protein At3g07870-like n=1 Tax=Papaver somniferum TaxID=3469 RepID=UPI000E700D58|nr:F-box protein At3g07870-like [Papaver somniferum]
MGNFKMLPGDIVFNILTRLPTETAVDCKLVSKSWNKVISHRLFPQSHLNRLLNNLDSAGSSGGKFTLLTANDNPIYAYRLFHFLEFYDKKFSLEDQPFHRVTRMKLNPAPFKFYYFCGSSNGLVCLNGCYDNEWVNYEPVYICNPITREFVYLPAFTRKPGRSERLVTGFGYVSKTNEYKVVRMYNLEKDPTSLRVEVYTLGSGKGWRNIGKKFNKELQMFIGNHGVLLNGSLYWVLQDGKIAVFDLASETFSELPEGFPKSWNMRLWVLGDYLAATHRDKVSKTFEIFLLKENKKKKNKNKKKKEDGPSLTWIKEFSLNNVDTYDYLVLTGRGTVLCRSKTQVQMYDLNSSSSKLLVDFGRDKGIFEAIPHMHTLVSLKALGEKKNKNNGNG